MGGWAICTTGILVVGSLADVAARYGLLLLGWDSAAGSKAAVTLIAVLIIAAMTAICVIGTELSARLQERDDLRAGAGASAVRGRGDREGGRRVGARGLDRPVGVVAVAVRRSRAAQRWSAGC
jgi:hypothetical protein